MSAFYPAAFYFFYYAALALISPFMALYYQQLSLSGGQIGVLLAVSPLVTLFAAPFWTGLADVRRWHKAILTLTLLAVILVMLVYPLFHSFGALLLVVLIFSFFVAPISPLVDSATLSMLADKPELYGRVRMWGTVGWGIFVLIAGFFLQRFGLQWMFLAYAVLMAFNLFFTFGLSFGARAAAVPFWSGMRGVFTNRRWVLFFGMVCIAGIGLSTQINYLGVLMEQVGGGKTLLGLALFITTLSEIPVLFFSSFFLRKLKSSGLLIVAVSFSGLRCLLYAFVGSPQLLLVLQLMHGFTFPMLWVAGVTYVGENAPQGLGSTLQALFGGVLMGIGMAIGGLLGGFLLEQVGISGMYLVLGLVVFVGLGIYLVLDRRMPRQGVA